MKHLKHIVKKHTFRKAGTTSPYMGGLGGLLFIALLASCTSDETVINPNAPVELRLTSGIEVETRAETQSTQIVKGKKVYVWVDDATTGKAVYEANELTADGSGNFTVGDKMYFPQTGYNVNIYALHGNFLSDMTKTGGTFTVTADQSDNGSMAYTNSDLLVACQEDVARSGNPTTQALTFYHALSKLELHIIVDESAPTLATSRAVTISDVITDGTFTADYTKDLSSQANRAGMVTAGTTTATMTLPQSTEEGNSNEAIIVPQSMAGKLLSFNLKDGGTLKYAFPTGTTFESGKKYIYKITLKLTGLVVTSTIEDWDGTENNSGDAVMSIGPKMLSAAAIGDYYTSDGELYSSDLPLFQLKMLKDKIIGVVFCVDQNRIGDAEKAALGGTVHGLVLAKTNAATNIKWSSTTTDISNLSNITTLQESYNDISGLANSKAIWEKYPNYGLSLFPAFQAAKNYSVAAPSSTTGWFLPSIGQWWDFMRNIGEMTVLDNKKSDVTTIYQPVTFSGTKMDANFDAKMEAMGGEKIGSYPYYWTSSEMPNGGVVGVRFYGSGNVGMGYVSKELENFSVRCVLAF